MTVSKLSFFLWFLGAAANLTLVVVLCRRRSWQRLWWFTVLPGYEFLRSIILVCTYQRGHGGRFYFWLFWISESVSLLLTLAVLFEVLWTVSAPVISSNARRTNKYYPVMVTALAVFSSFILSFAQHTSGNLRERVDAKVTVFISLLICQLYLALLIPLRMLALHIDKHLMTVCNGLALWSISDVVIDLIHEVHGWPNQRALFDNAKAAFVSLILFYWSVSFWEGIKPNEWNNKGTSLVKPRGSPHSSLPQTAE